MNKNKGIYIGQYGNKLKKIAYILKTTPRDMGTNRHRTCYNNTNIGIIIIYFSIKTMDD